MKFFKVTAMAVVVGAGLALVTSQAARAQESEESSSTYTSSYDGNTESFTLGAGISETQVEATSTSGTAIAAAIATPTYTASGGASLAGGSAFVVGEGPQTQGPNIPPSFAPNSSFGFPGQLGHVLDGGFIAGGLHIDNGETNTFALNHIALWINVDASSTQGSSTTSGTTATGISLAGLFVFGQTLAVPTGGSLTDSSPIAPTVLISEGDFNGDAGNVALNQVAGVGNQQGNNLSTFAEVTGSNSINVEGSQTLADAGEIGNNYGSGGETATIDVNAFQNVTGAIAVNQAAGVANEQVNNVALGH